MYIDHCNKFPVEADDIKNECLGGRETRAFHSHCIFISLLNHVALILIHVHA